MPFGPEISWPYGFRPLDAESRDMLESAYRTGAVYQQPAMDDHGYGDPGYSDPSYDGPRAQYGSHPGPRPPHGGPAFPGPHGGSRARGSGSRPSGGEVPGYHGPGTGGPSWSGQAGGPKIWPVTGAQEALRDTGPQPGSAAYPEQWYDNPRLDDRALDAPRAEPPRSGPPRSGPPRAELPRAELPRAELPRAEPPRSGPPAASPRPADPRLEGMNYDELRYDDPDPVTIGEPRYDEPLDDESWYQELRRSAPVYPRGFGPEHPSGPQRRVERQAPVRGRPPDHPQAPGAGAGSGPQRGGSTPQMSAGTGPRDSSAPAPGSFLSAPPAGVGVLTPPGGTRVGAFARPDTGQVLAPPGAERPGRVAVRPGHGLDGPEITASWPVQPSAGELESYEDFWREDDEEAEYSGLFGDSGAESARTAAAKRRTGRRRGRSNDHRLWLGLGGLVVLTAAAIAGVIKFEFPSHSGPAHTMVTPDQIGTYARTVDLEHQADVAELRADVIKMSAGKASRVVSAVYESGNSAAGGTEQIIMFIGGHLANADPGASVTSFTQKFPGARVVSAGPLGGRAACVETGNNVALCAWFDDDSFGDVVSPTMNASALAAALQTVRPSVERVAAK